MLGGAQPTPSLGFVEQVAGDIVVTFKLLRFIFPDWSWTYQFKERTRKQVRDAEPPESVDIRQGLY